MRFEWDRDKAASNLKKHGVSFDEAVTVFFDPLSATFSDPDHSLGERRLITVGYSFRGRLIVVCHTERRGSVRLSLVHAAPRSARGSVMKVQSPAEKDKMRPEYEFDYSTAVRGKYYRRLLKQGANVVVLEPDVARAFRSSAAVNEALRSLLKISEATRHLTTRSSGRRKAPAAERER